MKRTSIKRMLLSALAAGIVGYLSTGFDYKKPETPRVTERIHVNTFSGMKPVKLSVPVYDEKSVPANNCSKYARLAAGDVFGLSLPPAHAWDRRYHDLIVADAEEGSLESLAQQGVLNPGMVVGIYNPRSLFNVKKDMKGKRVKYTHVGLYLGTNYSGDILIAHKYGSRTEVTDLGTLERKGLKVREVLSAKPAK